MNIFLMYFSEGIDSKNGQIRMHLRVTHHVEIDELFKLQWLGSNVLENIHEQHRDVLASGHRVNDPSNSLHFNIQLSLVEFFPELLNLSSFFGHAADY